jgi:hypothetical protein
MNTFETSDIILAATLRVLGHKLVAIEKVGMKGTFHFNHVSEDVLNDFDCGKILVEPQSFNQQIRSLTTATRRAL